MKTLQVALEDRSYDIVIGQGIISQAAEYILKVCKPQRIMVVTDTTVASLHLPALQASLAATGLPVQVVSFAPGEGSKSLKSVEKLYTEAFAFGMTRTDLVIALGGGVIGDLTGFFAATLLRGVPFVQIPTTLLSQVDSSVGGKTGVNVPAGKNLVGSFYQPKLVLIDTDTLQTLSDAIFSDGMAEVIKYGCIVSEKLFEALLQAGSRVGVEAMLEDVIYACCDAKRQVVEEDELDTGRRMILNFGHTMGHVIEKAYNFQKYTHGQAVAYGMILAARLGEKLSVTAEGTAERITEILEKYHLPTDISLTGDWQKTILLDKKMQGKDLSCVLISKLGTSIVHKMPAEEFVTEIESIL